MFVLLVLGGIAYWAGFSILKFIAYIKEELLIVLGTSSSESVLPQMMDKMERLGCSKSVVGLVIPTGYSFNSDGTSIYLTMAAIFVAQATNTDLTLWQELTILAVLLLTSKGAVAVTGGGFITWRLLCRLSRPYQVGGFGAHTGYRPLHVGSSCIDQPGRQWCGKRLLYRAGRMNWTKSS